MSADILCQLPHTSFWARGGKAPKLPRVIPGKSESRRGKMGAPWTPFSLRFLGPMFLVARNRSFSPGVRNLPESAQKTALKHWRINAMH